MKKIYSTPFSVETKTRIRASILAGSNGTVTNAGQNQETLKMSNSLTPGTQPQTKTIGTRVGFFGE